MSESLARTTLYQQHLDANARMVPFAGWEMPVQYAAGILEEHRHTRTHAGLFDIGHMGEFRIRGAQAAAALDRRLARSVPDQPVGSCRYNLLLNEAGGILDDLVVYRIADDEFFLVVNAGCRHGDAAAIAAALPPDVIFTDESDATSKLDLQGPESAAVLAACGADIAQLPRYFRWGRLTLDGIDCLISRTGYTGELGFELYAAAEAAPQLWNRLLRDDRVRPIGLGARDTLRLEVGYPLYGHELDTEHTPDESGLGGIFSAAAERDFTGKSAWAKHTPASWITGLKIAGRRAARAGNTVMAGEAAIGTVTSGVFAPSLDYAIALARLNRQLPAGTPVEIDLGRARITAEVSETPFYTAGTARIKL